MNTNNCCDPVFSNNPDDSDVIISIGPDGKEVLSNILGADTGTTLTYKETNTYADGTPMDDTKVDGDVYIKRSTKYYQKTYDKEDRKTLTLNSVDELRNLTEKDIVLIRLGYYNKVETKGYYEDGDGGGVDYVTKYGTAADDGYLVIRTINDNNIYFTPNIKEKTWARLAGCRGDGILDDSPQLNLFFAQSLTLNNKILIDWSGDWYVYNPVYLIGDHRGFMSGELYYMGASVIEYILRIDTAVSTHSGYIRVRSNKPTSGNLTNYNSRKARNLCLLGRCSSATFDGFYLDGAKSWGLITSRAVSGEPADNIISADLGSIRAINCGSAGDRSGTQIWKVQHNFTNTYREGGTNSVNQEWAIEVEGVIDPYIQARDQIRIDKEIFRIKSIDREDNIMRVYPWPGVNVTEGTLFSNHGGAVFISTADGAQLKIKDIYALRCGVGLGLDALYGPVVSNITTQVVGISIVLKGQLLGTNILSFHSEVPPGTGIDVLKADTFSSRVSIQSASVLRYGDWYKLVARNSAGVATGATGTRMTGVSYIDAGGIKVSYPATNELRSNQFMSDGRISSGVVTLFFHEDIARLFGKYLVQAVWQDSNRPSANTPLTLRVNETDLLNGVTVMGGSEYVIPPQRYDVIVTAMFSTANSNWIISWATVPVATQDRTGQTITIGEGMEKLIETNAIIKSKSATLTTENDINAIAESETTIGNITLTDAAVGDIVNVTQLNTPGLYIKGIVSAANIIALSAINVSGTDKNIPEDTTFKVVILK